MREEETLKLKTDKNEWKEGQSYSNFIKFDIAFDVKIVKDDSVSCIKNAYDQK